MNKLFIIILACLLFSCNNEPKTYLDSAIDIMQENSIETENVDWKNLRNSAHKRVKEKNTIEETYPIIEDVLRQLGDQHSFFIKKQPATEFQEVDKKMPFVDAKIFDGQIAYLKIPAFNEDGEIAKKFATYIQSKITKLDRPEINGWIIDLSENYGGNMWPMYLGLAPILGEGISGYFLDWEKNSAEWSFSNNTVYTGKDIKLEVENSYTLKKKAPKIAVLIGEMTASSGEAIAITFKGLPCTKFFGKNTAGLSTGNVVYPLSDGAKLVLTTTIMADRTKKLYGGQISPDIITNNPKEKAIEWLVKEK
ncbi:Peptidase family S41 [Zobellia uliginosa]|uniref:Peptidase family S41 n=1 Tax=Zobellia uliginosa TaxID=143224 RepID=A0ABY1KLE2_9FLAO|nr:S41 family peptidase [Zobellia uliginosa]SIS47397.1 Peptidase family S41 [Zobellia uliginosa]